MNRTHVLTHIIRAVFDLSLPSLIPVQIIPINWSERRGKWSWKQQFRNFSPSLYPPSSFSLGSSFVIPKREAVQSTVRKYIQTMGIQSAAKCKRERLAEYEDYMSESSAGGSIGGIGIARIGFLCSRREGNPIKGGARTLSARSLI